METPQSNRARERKDKKSVLSLRLENLISKSKFKRTNPDNPVTDLEIGEERYSISSIERGDDPDITQIQKLFIETFGEDEVDPEEILRNAVDGKTPWEGVEDETKYRIFTVKDKEGKVISVLTGANLELLDENDEPTGKTIFMTAFAVTDKSVRQAGFASEVYISAIMDAQTRAKAEGRELAFAAGECTYTSEKFWNKVGWKRVYAENVGSEKKSYSEIKYVQPALDFDETSGEVAEDAGEVPEHFMIDSFADAPPSKDEIMQTIRAFYNWCNRWPREAFENEEAYNQQQEYINDIETTFKNELGKKGQLIFLTQTEREQKEITIAIEGYPEADIGKSGEEDV